MYHGSNHPGLSGVATLTAIAPKEHAPCPGRCKPNSCGAYLDLSQAIFQDDAPETIKAVGFPIKVDLKLAWGV